MTDRRQGCSQLTPHRQNNECSKTLTQCSKTPAGAATRCAPKHAAKNHACNTCGKKNAAKRPHGQREKCSKTPAGAVQLNARSCRKTRSKRIDQPYCSRKLLLPFSRESRRIGRWVGKVFSQFGGTCVLKQVQTIVLCRVWTDCSGLWLLS